MYLNFNVLNNEVFETGCDDKMDGNLKIVMLLPIWQIENWIWKIFCPGKEDCEKLNNLHPKNYPPPMYAVFRSPPRRTNNTAPFVHFAQKT